MLQQQHSKLRPASLCPRAACFKRALSELGLLCFLQAASWPLGLDGGLPACLADMPGACYAALSCWLLQHFWCLPAGVAQQLQ